MTPREAIGELLRRVWAPGEFAARRTAAADDLAIEVKGVGPLRFPIARAQAQRLCEVARPARYGRGEETLLDRGVRDTWEVPRSRVKIDQRRWNRTLLPALEAFRAELGLPEGCRLTAELHNLLVYGPGQFFARHQDSETADAMIGTLVVTLPSPFTGGAFVIEHRGETVTYRAPRSAKKPLSLVAFYADCHHEVRPVTEGYRIALTYHLLLEGEGAATVAGAAGSEPATVAALAERLRAHFETPRPPRWTSDTEPQEPPDRLVFLLDHQYTERGFGWDRLKGDDAARVAVLQAAAERAGCEVLLALAEIQETWESYEEGWDEPWQREGYRWERDEDDEWYEVDEPPPAAGPDRYDLVSFIDSEITLDRWIEPSGKAAVPIVAHVGDDEVCHATPTSDLEPYASEYEGYMGNYGNTMDRWYRRGAVVLWPRERAFSVRARASAAWAVDEVAKQLRSGAVSEARETAESLLAFWPAAAESEGRRGFFGKVLRVAQGLDAPELAASLLGPFRVEALTPPGAPAFAALVERYGERWMRALLWQWSDPRRPWTHPGRQDREAWLGALPALCEALRKADEDGGTRAARLLLEDGWVWWQREIELAQTCERPSLRARRLAELPKPLLGWLEATAAVDAADLREAALSFLCAADNEDLLPCLVQILRRAAATMEPATRDALDLEALTERCARLLEARLAVPARGEGDWSLALPEGCHCELCRTLADFLADPQRSRFEWPIAKERRRHVHGRLDAHELPVRHETRRSGSPYTLVLTKTRELFERESAERRTWQADLEWLS
jgi:predicted 2-oxoglutarate/Fe(II)-dependent dioxygenase YbiX